MVAADELTTVQQTLARSEDAAEGLQSFIERCDPVFKGR